MNQIQQAAIILRAGGIIAYPTEAVFGLGCDPHNEKAVTQLLKLKNRSVTKGLILIAAAWDQLQAYIDVEKIPAARLTEVFSTWPGPVTWVFPASSLAPKWITGSHITIAVRITNHPIAKLLCDAFGGAIVSTSANLALQPPVRSASEVKKIFSNKIDLIVSGMVGGLENPSEIRDAITGKILRGL